MQILSVGEILWDVIDGVEHLGGAPFNFAAHAARLGHRAYLFSAVGDDERGVKALAGLSKRSVNAAYVGTTPKAATGCAIVTSGAQGDASFTIPRPAAYDFLHESDPLLHDTFDAVYFGTLLQTFEPARSALHRVLRAFPQARRFYDVNLRAGHYSLDLVRDAFARASIVKLNQAEAEELGAGQALRRWCESQAALFGWESVAVTRGAQGCAVWLAGQYAEQSGIPVIVADTIGAGDAFSAALLHGIGQGWNVENVGGFANRAGALAASSHGAFPA